MHPHLFTAALLQLLLVLLLSGSTTPDSTNGNLLQYAGYRTARVQFKSKVAITRFLEFMMPGESEFYAASYPDVFLSVPTTSGATEILLPSNETQRDSILQFLRINRIMYDVGVTSEFDRALRRQARRLEKVQKYETIGKIVGYFARYSEMQTWLRMISRAFPQIVSIESIGKSFEGRPLLAVKVGLTRHRHRPIIFIESGMHGREWLAPASCIWIIDQVVKNYAYEQMRAPSLLNLPFNFIFVIVANPDGYEYTHTSDRLWRKTRSNTTISVCADSSCRERQNVSCIGVDGNRNWDAHFGEMGTTGDCRETYPGPRPFSEIEVHTLAKYIHSLRSSLRFYMSLHATGQTWVIPPGHVRSHLRNHAAQLKYAKLATAAIKRVGGPDYVVGTHAELQYMVSGSSTDWVIEQDVPFAATVHLSPFANASDYKSDSSALQGSSEQVGNCGRYLLAALRTLALAMDADASPR